MWLLSNGKHRYYDASTTALSCAQCVTIPFSAKHDYMQNKLVYPTLGPAHEKLQSLPITGFTTDSRKILPGNVFVCHSGLHQDGHDYIDQAVQLGAIAIIATQKTIPLNIPVIIVPDFNAALTLVSDFYNHPQRQLFNIAVTGTNGKTTVAWSLAQLLENTAYTGTLGCLIKGELTPLVNTTPDALTLLSMMNKMVDKGIRCQVMEVSSHALSQGRTAQIEFDMVIYTNIGADHLDYHGSQEAYAEAKLTLLNQLRPGGHVIINLDDTASTTILARCPTDANIITYSLSRPDATLQARDIEASLQGSRFQLEKDGKELAVTTPLAFRYNLENSLAVLGASYAISGDIEGAASALAKLSTVPGRSETLPLVNGAIAMVDYAHNKDGLESLLTHTRTLMQPDQRILLVTGLTGERLQDAETTGAVCSELADRVWFTCHNPLGLPPDAVPLAMMKQADHNRCCVTIDRQQAIAQAISQLNTGDLLLVCGKGQENYQYMNADKNQPEPYIGDTEAIRIGADQLTI